MRVGRSLEREVLDNRDETPGSGLVDRIDPMIVIRWKDLFAVLERAIDATETAAHILEGIVIKNA